MREPGGTVVPVLALVVLGGCSGGEAGTFEVGFLEGGVANQFVVEIPLTYRMPEPPSPSLSVTFEKKGLFPGRDYDDYLRLPDGFLGPEGQSLIATGFHPPELASGKYALSGIFYQGKNEEGNGEQANCQKHDSGSHLDCYDNGALRPESYTVVPVKSEPIPEDELTEADLSTLEVSGTVEHLASGEQEVVVTVSSQPLILQYFLNPNSFIAAPGQISEQLEFFQPRELSFPEAGGTRVSARHRFPAISRGGSGRATAELVGARIDVLTGRDRSHRKIEIVCNTSADTYDVHLGNADPLATELPCAYLR